MRRLTACSYVSCPYLGRFPIRLGRRVVYRVCKHHRQLYTGVVQAVRAMLDEQQRQGRTQEVADVSA